MASAVARHQAEKSNYVTNCRHERVLLRRLDGTRGTTELSNVSKKTSEQAQESLKYFAKLALLVE